MVLEISPPLEDRLRKVAARLHLDQNGMEKWLLTVLDGAMPGEESITEGELLRRVNEGFPAEWWEEYHRLAALRNEETITESDLTTLIAMTNAAEERHAERLEALSELAQRRGVEPVVLMRQMGLTPGPLAAA